MAAKVVHGARAKVFIVDGSGNARVVGIWNNFSYGVTYDVQPAFILGRFSAGDLVTTAVEPVSITAQGWRVVDHGPWVEGGLSNIKDLLNQNFLLLQVYDRQTKKFIASVRGCLPTGTSSGASAKQLMELTNTYLGLLMDDESVANNEASDAASIPG